MGLAYNASVVTDGLILFLDPANKKSYSGSGNIISDLKTSSASTLVGTCGINNSSYKVSVLDLNNNGTTSDGQVQISTQDLNSLALTQNFSVMFAAKKNFYGLSGNNVGNSQLFQGATNGYNTGWRISESSQSTPGTAFTGRHTFTFGLTEINTSLSVSDSDLTNRMAICAFTVSPSTISGFLNGVTTSRSNPLNYVAGTSQPYISFTGAGVGSWNGQIGFFMIYNKTLSTAEIQQNFIALRGRYGI